MDVGTSMKMIETSRNISQVNKYQEKHTKHCTTDIGQLA